MISDPWEFGTECGVGPFYGKLIDYGVEKIANVDVETGLVKLEQTVSYLNTNYVSALCHIRHEGASLADLEAGLDVSVNITLLLIDGKTLSSIREEDFRNGFAATGSLQFV